MSIIPPAGAEITLTFGPGTTSPPILVVFGVGNAEDLNAETVLSRVVVAFTGTLLQSMSHQLELQEAKSEFADGSQFIAAVGAFGGDGADTAPPNVAYLLHKRSGFTGRRNRGRMYLPGVCVDSIAADGSIGSEKWTELDGNCDSFVDELESEDVPLVIFHSTLPSIPTLVTAFQPDHLAATQRRRLRG